MTTIATDGNSMAGDGRVTCNGAIVDEKCHKVHRLNDGGIAGFCGGLTDGFAFIEWLHTGGNKPSLSEGFEGLIVTPVGNVIYFDEKCHPAPQPAPYAIGSGYKFALAALDFGKTPQEAVKYAMKRDSGTGGRIRVIERTEA